MIILITILIIVMLLIIRNSILMEPIVRNNIFGSPDYDAKFVTITLVLKDQMLEETRLDIQEIFYIQKRMSLDDAKTYIMKHRELYSEELSNIEIRNQDKTITESIIEVIDVEIGNFK